MLYEHIDLHTKLTYPLRAGYRVNEGLGMKRQSENLLTSDETWRAILEPALCQDPAAVETLVRLLFSLKKAIEDGPEGANSAIKALSDGIEFIYPYTKAHQAALRLYTLSLEGNLNPHDEPLNLINAAIARGQGRIH